MPTDDTVFLPLRMELTIVRESNTVGAIGANDLWWRRCSPPLVQKVQK